MRPSLVSLVCCSRLCQYRPAFQKFHRFSGELKLGPLSPPSTSHSGHKLILKLMDWFVFLSSSLTREGIFSTFCTLRQLSWGMKGDWQPYEMLGCRNEMKSWIIFLSILIFLPWNAWNSFQKTLLFFALLTGGKERCLLLYFLHKIVLENLAKGAEITLKLERRWEENFAKKLIEVWSAFNNGDLLLLISLSIPIVVTSSLHSHHRRLLTCWSPWAPSSSSQNVVDRRAHFFLFSLIISYSCHLLYLNEENESFLREWCKFTMKKTKKKKNSRSADLYLSAAHSSSLLSLLVCVCFKVWN